MARLLPCILAASSVALLAAAPAGAASRFTIRGAGFGHGVGMSQYGAYGFALKGTGYREILGHYYTDTRIGSVGTRRVVRVLMQSLSGSASFTGATRAAGRRLNPRRTYRVRRGAGGMVELLSPRGRRLKRVVGVLRVTGPSGRLVLRGRALNGRVDGAYRGALEFRPGYLGVAAINAVRLENYLRGVVPDEMPPSWHPEALKAQAVAARTYAMTTSKGGDGFDHYPDTRSQVYGGVAAEEPTTDAAIVATRGEVVTYGGEPVVTYFFSTSGGRTEDVENTSLGTEPRPWLKSVKDPYDDVSPRHRWGPTRMTLKQAKSKLGNLVKGSFRGIEVLERGRSPRIVRAEVVGSRGRVATDGATLRARLGLYDTWAYFASITTDEEPAPDDVEPEEPDPTGGASPEARAARRTGRHLAGRVLPAPADVVVQQRSGGRWVRVGVAAAARSGRYAFTLTAPGTYRVRAHGAAGPAVRVR